MPTPWDAFCAGHAFMADGRLLVVGGTTAYPSAATNNNNAGSKQAYLFDPITESYQRVADTHLARWYPTVTELGDGRQFVLAGLDEAGHRTNQSEIFDGSTWTTPKPGPSAYTYQPMYPALHLDARRPALLLRRQHLRQHAAPTTRPGCGTSRPTRTRWCRASPTTAGATRARA